MFSIPIACQIVDRRAQPHGVGDVARAGLEACRRRLVEGPLEGDVLDHVAAALPRRHRVQQVPLAVKRRRCRSARTPCAREHVQVAVERLHVDRHVGHGLGAVDQHQRAVAVGQLDHRRDRRDRPERVRHVGERHDPRPRAQQPLVFVEHHLAAVVDRRHAQSAPVSWHSCARERCWRGARAR